MIGLIGDQPVMKHIYLLLFFIFFFVHCGSIPANPILPLATIPLPSQDDGVIISAPQEARYVIVSGRSEFIPDQSSLVIQVGEDLSKNEEYCPEDIPVCPSLDHNQQCRFDKPEYIDFEFRVPADLNDRLSLSFLDDVTCQDQPVIEVEVLEEEVLIEREIIEEQAEILEERVGQIDSVESVQETKVLEGSVIFDKQNRIEVSPIGVLSSDSIELQTRSIEERELETELFEVSDVQSLQNWWKENEDHLTDKQKKRLRGQLKKNVHSNELQPL